MVVFSSQFVSNSFFKGSWSSTLVRIVLFHIKLFNVPKKFFNLENSSFFARIVLYSNEEMYTQNTMRNFEFRFAE